MSRIFCGNFVEANLGQIISCITIFEKIVKDILIKKLKILQLLHLALPLAQQQYFKVKKKRFCN